MNTSPRSRMHRNVRILMVIRRGVVVVANKTEYCLPIICVWECMLVKAQPALGGNWLSESKSEHNNQPESTLLVLICPHFPESSASPHEQSLPVSKKRCWIQKASSLTEKDFDDFDAAAAVGLHPPPSSGYYYAYDERNYKFSSQFNYLWKVTFTFFTNFAISLQIVLLWIKQPNSVTFTSPRAAYKKIQVQKYQSFVVCPSVW